MSHNFQKFYYLLLVCLVTGITDIAEAGSVQFSTYYPAPFGMYDRLRLVPRAALAPPCDPGTMYINTDAGNQLEVCNAAGDAWAPLSGGPWTQDVNGVYVTDITADVGIGTTTPEFRLTLDKGAATPDGGILAIGTFGSGTALTTTGAGTRLIWYPRKAAFRMGQVSGSQWNDVNIGAYSVAMGYDELASGSGSVALGTTNTASGTGSFALGGSLTVAGDYSAAIGSNITLPAAADYSFALGYQINTTNVGGVGIGAYLRSGAAGAAVLGSGVDSSNPLVNNTALSLAIGLNSNIPTLFIGPSSGVGTTGNVGIGTAVPTSRLHVNAPQGDAPPGVFLENADITVDGGADGKFALRNNSASGTRKISLSGPGLGTEVMTVDALTARVGIGTTNPQGGLHILDFSPSGAVAGLLIERNSQSLGRTPRVVLVDTALGAVTAAPTWNIDNSLDQFRIFRQANISTAGPGVLSINNNGNVVIGTTAPGPAYKLEVTGGPIKATGGFILETRTTNPAAPVAGQMWLCTDTGDATPCNGI